MDENKSSWLRKKAEKILQNKGVKDPSLYNKDLETLVEELSIHQIELEQQNEELKNIQNELERSRDRYSDLFNKAPVGYFIIQKDYKIINVNDTGLKLLSVSKNELSNRLITKYIHPDSQDTFYFHLKEALKTGKSQYCELLLKKPDGKTFWAAMESIPEKEEDNKRYSVVRSAVRDISVQKEKHKIESWLSTIVNSTDDAIIGISKEKKILSWNKGAEKIYGYTEDEVAGKTPEFLLPEDKNEEVDNYFETVLKGEFLNHYETVRVKKNGEKVDVSLSVSPIYDENKIIGIATVARDITARKKQKKILQESEEKYRAIFENSGDGFFLMKDKIMDCNKQAALMFGFPMEKLKGMNPASDLSPQKQPNGDSSEVLGEKYVNEALAGKQKQFYWKHKTKQGELIDTEITLSLVNTVKGKHLLAVIHDISEQVEYQNKLKEKNEEIEAQNEEYAALNEELNEANERLKKTVTMLEESEEKFRNYIESSPTAVIITDNKENFQYLNPAALRLTEYTDEEIYSRKVKNIHPSTEIDRIKLEREKIKEDTNLNNFETQIQTKRGRIKDVIVNSVKLSENRIIEFYTDITERKIAEKKLKEANDIIVKSPAVAFLWKNEEGWPVEYVSENVYRIFGYEDSEFISGKVNFVDFIHKDDLNRVMKEVKDYSKDENRTEFTQEYRIKNKKGEIKWIDDRTWIQRDSKGNITHFKGIILDITERKMAEKQIVDTNKKLDSILSSISDGFYVLDQKLNVTYFNEAAEELVNKSRDEVINRHIFQAFPEAKNSIFEKKYDEALKTGENLRFETYFGESPYENWYDVRIYPFDTGLSVYFQVTTARKQAIESLKRSEEKFKTLFSSASDAIFIHDFNGNIIEVNNFACEKLNYSREELLKLTPKKLTTPKNSKKFDKELQRIIDKGFSSYETEHITKDGKVLQVEINSTLIEYYGEKAVLKIARDITERKRAERELLIKNRISNSFINSDHDDFYKYILDIFREVFEAHYGYFGYINEEGNLVSPSLTRDVWKQCQEENKSIVFPKNKWAGLWGESLKKQKTLYQNKNLNPPKGHVELKSAIAAPIMLKNSLIGQISLANKKDGFSEDDKELINNLCDYIAPLLHSKMQEEKYKNNLLEAKEKAEESDKLKSAFLANMSHEIRTPMNGIIGFTELLRTTKVNPDKERQFLNIIDKRSRHLLQLINDIIDISKIEANQIKIDKEPFFVNNVLKELEEVFKNEIRTRGKEYVKLYMQNGLSSHNLRLNSDETRIRQILTNLLSNAIKFTDKGSVTFGAKEENNGKLTFFVEDTGMGIPEEKKEEIFNRFQQVENLGTKKYGGVGLGLSISKSLTDLLGGEIWVESEEGKGSRFAFTIPLEEVNSEKGEPKIDNNKERFKTKFYWENEKVLIVEDDPVSQDFIKEILSPANLNIIVKKNGGEALETFENTDDIKLILMDIQLPDMSGLEVTRKIREKNKKIPIIAQTAFAMAEDREKAIKAGCNDYVTKPLNSNRLLNLIDGFLKKEK